MKKHTSTRLIGTRIISFLFILLSVFLLTGCQEAIDEFLANLSADKTQWYVATTGNDKNPCHTPGSPCRNIATVITRAVDDDTIHIADGSYYEQLTLTKRFTIIGATMANTIIDAQYTERPLTLDGTGRPNGFNLDLSNLTLTGGAVGEGGGLYLSRGASVVLTNVEIRDNVGHSAGGGIYSDNTARLYLNNVSIHDNQTSTSAETESRGGGVFFGTGEVDKTSAPEFFELHIDGSHIYNNNAYLGGGIYNEATMTVRKSIVETNTAGSQGGGINNIYDASISMSKINKNSALTGGGIYNGSLYGVGKIPGMNVDNTEISGNTAKVGAGILNSQGLVLNNSTVWGNIASSSAGGIHSTTDIDDPYEGTWAGKFYATNSTISNNSAPFVGGIIIGSSTEYDKGGFEGTNLTIANNIGGGVYFHFGSLKMTNILLSENDGKNCDFAHAVTIITSMSNDDTCPGFIEADAGLIDLADNGGLTLTHALLPGSAARDTGMQIPGGLYTDQREFTRPLDGDGDGNPVIDIGALEAEYQTFIFKTLIPSNTPVEEIKEPPVFNPGKTANCREGPSIFWRSLGQTKVGSAYPITGANVANLWYYIQLSDTQKCWVKADTGTPSGDLSGVEMLVVKDITPTPTLIPTITPTVIPQANCGAYTSADQCGMHPECEWNATHPSGPRCENK